MRTPAPPTHFLWAFVLLTACIVIVGWFYVRQSAQHFRAEAQRQLSVVADLKVGELTQWRKERLTDGLVFFKNPSFAALVRRFFETPSDADAQRQLHDWLGRYPAHDNYNKVCLLDTQGVSRLDLPAGQVPTTSGLVRAASEVLGSGQIAIQDFYRDEHDLHVHLAVLVPILDEQEGSRPLGILVLRTSPETYLYPLIKRWPTPSKTAETLLVRREGNEVVFLNELRFRTNTALNVRMSLDQVVLPAAQAALGREGVMEGVDYRGVGVLAALRTVPDSPWAIVARVDNEEVNAPWRTTLWQLVTLFGAFLIAAGSCTWLFWRQQNLRYLEDRVALSDVLRNSEVRYRRLFEAARDGVLILDAETERKRAEAELDRMRNLLAEDQRIAHLGSWEYRAETQETLWSEEQLRIYGLNPAGPSPDYQVMLRNHIHPEDAARLGASSALRGVSICGTDPAQRRLGCDK
jgi:PAS domain-containing protein